MKFALIGSERISSDANELVIDQGADDGSGPIYYRRSVAVRWRRKKMGFAARTKLALFSSALCITLVAPPPAFADQLGDAYAAYERSGYTEALRLWRPLAEEGDPVAQFWIGHMYRTGRGVEQNIEEAIKWFRRAAEQHEPMAEYIMGFLYRGGDGVPEDIDEAVKWFRLAAEHGDIEALEGIGKFYASGEWRPHDDALFREWYHNVVESYRAKEHGFGPDSQYRMGLIHERGGLVPANPRDAESWFKKAFDQYRPAAEAGDYHAQCMLYHMYRLGQGVSKSHKESERWLILALQEKPVFPCFQELYLVK